MKLIALSISLILLMGGGLYYQFVYPPSVMKRNAAAALLQVEAAVETQDRAKVSATLASLITDDARIHLDVSFSAINSANVRPASQDFDKAQFIAFIDNILYTLSDFHYRANLREFNLTENVAAVKFTSSQRADGPSYYSGVSVMVRFSGETECTGEVVFTEMQPKMRALTCSVLLRSVTKTDSATDMIGKASELRDIINRQNQR